MSLSLIPQPGVLLTELQPTCHALLFDFKAAFPSVSWKWLFFVLGKAGLPEGILTLPKAMYTCVLAFSEESSEEKLFDMFSGMVQGCPLSGSLFVLVIKPLLIAMQGISLDKQQVVFTVCADDIGIVLQELCSRPRVADLSAAFEKSRRCNSKRQNALLFPQRLMSSRPSKVPPPLRSQSFVLRGATLR